MLAILIACANVHTRVRFVAVHVQVIMGKDSMNIEPIDFHFVDAWTIHCLIDGCKRGRAICTPYTKSVKAGGNLRGMYSSIHRYSGTNISAELHTHTGM